MRTGFLLVVFCCNIFWFGRISGLPGEESGDEEARKNSGGFSEFGISATNTGRMFVTMLGYPARCERKGSTYPCTLSFACWLEGGSSHSGCGASSWIVACCVISKKGKIPLVHYNKLDSQLEKSTKPVLREENSLVPMLQNRIVDAEEECGLSADRILSKRIIGGREAKFGQYPWQAFIKIDTYQCGGVLVSRRFVATAAHCIVTTKLKDILVYLGELDTQDTGKVKEFEPAELHRVRRKIIHPDFQYLATQPDRYDVALLELFTETKYSYHISPICLPEQNLNLRGRSAVVAGWGKIQPSNELMGTNVLRSAIVPILGLKDCKTWHEIKQISVELHEEMLCAGHESGKYDACLGDSGGPLIVLEKGRWTLAGIISAGFGCGEPHQPGIYHKVPVTVDWIRSVIGF